MARNSKSMTVDVLEERMRGQFEIMEKWRENEKEIGKEISKRIETLEKKIDVLIWKIVIIIAITSGLSAAITKMIQ